MAPLAGQRQSAQEQAAGRALAGERASASAPLLAALLAALLVALRSPRASVELSARAAGRQLLAPTQQPVAERAVAGERQPAPGLAQARLGAQREQLESAGLQASPAGLKRLALERRLAAQRQPVAPLRLVAPPRQAVLAGLQRQRAERRQAAVERSKPVRLQRRVHGLLLHSPAWKASQRQPSAQCNH